MKSWDWRTSLNLSVFPIFGDVACSIIIEICTTFSLLKFSNVRTALASILLFYIVTLGKVLRAPIFQGASYSIHIPWRHGQHSGSWQYILLWWKGCFLKALLPLRALFGVSEEPKLEIWCESGLWPANRTMHQGLFLALLYCCVVQSSGAIFDMLFLDFFAMASNCFVLMQSRHT